MTVFNPAQLSELILEALEDPRPSVLGHPTAAALDEIASICFLASLQQEELQPTVFRLGYANPSLLTAPGALTNDETVMLFREPRPFTVEELRKISGASDYARTLLLIGPTEENKLAIVGLLHTGVRWLRARQGGRGGSRSFYPGLAFHVTAPGSIEAYLSGEQIVSLVAGEFKGPQLDVFRSQWLPARFARIRDELHALHLEQLQSLPSSIPRVDVEPMLFGRLSQQMLKRLIASVQARGHGGTVLIIPHELESTFIQPGSDLRFRASFPATPERQFHRRLMLQASEIVSRSSASILTKAAGWEQYAESTDPHIDLLDELIFEESYFIAALTNIDGAVLMNDRLEILGFGAEILCNDVRLSEVAFASDLEGRRVRKYSIEGFGTRHRSAFRFAWKYPDSMAVVVSQDSSVRFVTRLGDQLTAFEHDSGASPRIVI